MVVNRQYYDIDDAPEVSYHFDKEILQKALKHIYEKDFNPMTEIEENLFNAFWKDFNEATDEGFGVRDTDDPDFEFYQALRNNNGVFSAFKTHRAQNDMAALLLNEDGTLKSFNEWEKAVKPIADHQVDTWLKTEHDTAVLRAHQAAEWKQFERDKDILPNLRWEETTSVNPGQDHMIYWINDLVRPIDDSFWNRHRPGDRWNCKCSLSQTDDPVTDIPGEKVESNPNPGLDNNPGKDAVLFNDNHPYFPDSCSNCSFYKPKLKDYLFHVFTNKAKDCKNCSYLKNRIDATLRINK